MNHARSSSAQLLENLHNVIGAQILRTTNLSCLPEHRTVINRTDQPLRNISLGNIVQGWRARSEDDEGLADGDRFSDEIIRVQAHERTPVNDRESHRPALQKLFDARLGAPEIDRVAG